MSVIQSVFNPPPHERGSSGFRIVITVTPGKHIGDAGVKSATDAAVAAVVEHFNKEKQTWQQKS